MSLALQSDYNAVLEASHDLISKGQIAQAIGAKIVLYNRIKQKSRKYLIEGRKDVEWPVNVRRGWRTGVRGENEATPIAKGGLAIIAKAYVQDCYAPIELTAQANERGQIIGSTTILDQEIANTLVAYDEMLERLSLMGNLPLTLVNGAVNASKTVTVDDARWLHPGMLLDFMISPPTKETTAGEISSISGNVLTMVANVTCSDNAQVWVSGNYGDTVSNEQPGLLSIISDNSSVYFNGVLINSGTDSYGGIKASDYPLAWASYINRNTVDVGVPRDLTTQLFIDTLLGAAAVQSDISPTLIECADESVEEYAKTYFDTKHVECPRSDVPDLGYKGVPVLSHSKVRNGQIPFLGVPKMPKGGYVFVDEDDFGITWDHPPNWVKDGGQMLHRLLLTSEGGKDIYLGMFKNAWVLTAKTRNKHFILADCKA